MMMRVSYIHDVEKFELVDKNGVNRKLKVYVKNNNIYIGPLHGLFNRNFVCKDSNRIDFVSKLDLGSGELMHVSVIFDKIKKHRVYSNYTIDLIKEFLYGKGFTDEDFKLQPKNYTCAKEHFIEYGFNSMNVCLDRREDVWVHYKDYEETKQYKEIISKLSKDKIKEFEKEYKKMSRFIRYANVDENGNVKCFALKSVNITKLYRWASDNHIIHKINYVSDIYHEAVRIIDLEGTTVDNTYIKVTVTEDGLILKQSTADGIA